jgi:cytochrome c oxidase cbb3-type subunit 1
VILDLHANIGLAIIWLIFFINIFATVIKRQERQIYISLWFILATIIGTPILYIIGDVKPFPFIFAMPILAMFYYFLPAATRLPIYSRWLAIASFWGLIIAYIGIRIGVYDHIIMTVFSIFLIVPVWASVINGYVSIESDWRKLSTNYLTKFFLVGITIYGLQAIQGAAQSLQMVDLLLWRTDWGVGHIHFGTMGWMTLIICASMYHVFPRIYNTQIYSVRLANASFWFVFFGMVIFSVSSWMSGVKQGAMRKMISSEGTLAYTFMDTLEKIYPFLYIRTMAGVVFAIGIGLFMINIVITMGKGRQAHE